jgi:hypothetical protein
MRRTEVTEIADSILKAIKIIAIASMLAGTATVIIVFFQFQQSRRPWVPDTVIGQLPSATEAGVRRLLGEPSFMFCDRVGRLIPILATRTVGLLGSPETSGPLLGASICGREITTCVWVYEGRGEEFRVAFSWYGRVMYWEYGD